MAVAAPGGLPELPRELDGFVGRARELTQLTSLLRSTRLLTLTGSGGGGKTRLALKLARGVRGGRVGLVELDSLPNGDLLAQFVAVALGVGEGTSAPEEALLAALRNRRTLLVLDNCEHVVDACAQLVDGLLRRCQGLRILATSREALRVPGEVVFRLGELSLPAADAEDTATVLRSDAVRLFALRARAAKPGFQLTGCNAGLVAEICRRVDGVALAIELAARRAGGMSLKHILAGLDDQLTLLTDGSWTGPRHHRELGAAIDWSYRLLGPLEQAVFRRLSVLVGGFGLDGAAAVCAGDGVEPTVVPRLVYALEAKSLVVAVSGDRTEVRYRQLNAIRAYGLERLEAAGELADTWERAADWLARLIRPPAGPLYFGDELTRELQHEPDNLVAVVDYTAAQRDDRHVLLAMALACLWQQREHRVAGRRLLAATLERVPDSAYQVNVLALAARMACFQADQVEGLRLAERAVAVAKTRADPAELADAVDTWALALMTHRDLGAAVAAYRECLDLVQSLGRQVDIAFCQHVLAWALFSAGEVAEAEELMAECLADLRALASSAQLSVALNTEGVLRLAVGDLDTAEAAFVAAMSSMRPDGYHVACAVEGLAIVAARLGDPHRALCLSSAAASVRRRIDVPAEEGWLHQVDAAIGAVRGRLRPANVDAAVAAGRDLRGNPLLAYARREPDHETSVESVLTERELQIAKLVAEGLTNRQIAEKLRLSYGTVSAHLNRVRDKLDLRSRTRIALWVSAHPRAEFRNTESR